MGGVQSTVGPAVVIDGLGALFEALRARGFRIVGPTVRDSAIIYDDLS